jgi:hypothetical protein
MLPETGCREITEKAGVFTADPEGAREPFVGKYGLDADGV